MRRTRQLPPAEEKRDERASPKRPAVAGFAEMPRVSPVKSKDDAAHVLEVGDKPGWHFKPALLARDGRAIAPRRLAFQLGVELQKLIQNRRHQFRALLGSQRPAL